MARRSPADINTHQNHTSFASVVKEMTVSITIRLQISRDGCDKTEPIFNENFRMSLFRKVGAIK